MATLPPSRQLARWQAGDPAGRASAARALRSGAVGLLPTESSYALAASIANADAVARVRSLKGRGEAGKPLLVLCSDRAMVEELVVVPAAATRWLERWWPGPLTLVMPARDRATAELLGGRGVAVRVPACPATLAVIALAGHAVTGTSANRAGEPPLLRPDLAGAGLPSGTGGVAFVLDAGLLPGGPPSTLVDACDEEPRIVREGAISARDLVGPAA